MSGIKPTAWLCKDYPPFLPRGQWAWRLTMEEPTNGLGDALIKLSEHKEEIARLRSESRALREGLEAIYQYGSDTMRGPTGDTPDDRKWHRDAVLEMTNRASRTVDTGSWKKDDVWENEA